MELPAVNLKAILLVHWLLTTCFSVAWPPSSWTSSTSASSTLRLVSRTRGALALAWPSSACSSSRSPAASSTTCTGSVGVSSCRTLVSSDLHRSAAPTRRLTHQRHPRSPLPAWRAEVTPPKGTEGSPAAPAPRPGLPCALDGIPGVLLTPVSWTC
uniref:Angiotensin II receptor associated protein n=1 Tax=Equus asinus TaxID=9793 RepID=A0A9L0IDF1_EQUAS